jgi:hypothetical protein
MRGFIRSSNLNESSTADSDKRILDNLAGAGISADISLFSNNLKNTSQISTNDYIFLNNNFVLTNSFMLPFSNNTIVTYNNIEYVVKNSNLKDSFQLFLPSNLNSPFIPQVPFKDIIRKDNITFENITNLNPQRLETKLTTLGGIESTSEFDPYTAYGINENVNAIVQSIETYEYKRNTALMTDKPNSVDVSLVVNGTVVITNLDANGNPNTGNFNVDEDPGMFISNGTSKIRAFSDSSQPWTKVSGALATVSEEVNINNLIMTNPSITGISVTTITEEIINTSLKNVYYSVPVTINNENYFLLCKKVI